MLPYLELPGQACFLWTVVGSKYVELLQLIVACDIIECNRIFG